jgi:fermentation-respiration switch protein FrsA (DUF1100 family)
VAYLSFAPGLNQRLYQKKLFSSEDGVAGSEVLLANFHEYENHEVMFKGAEGQNLRGWYFKHPNSKWVYLFCMGRGSDIPKNLETVRVLLETGASVFVFEYRGFGQSEGTPTLTGVVDDASSAFEVVVNQLGYSQNQIITYGQSLGGGIATELLKRFHPRAHVIQSSYSSLEAIGKEMVPALRIYPGLLFPNPRLNTANTLSGNETPVFIIVGVHDNVIPPHHALEIYNAAAGPKRLMVLTHSGHVDIEYTDRAALVRELSQFLRSL